MENAATDDCNVFNDGQHWNVFLDDQDVDNSLIESTTMETDCIDFGTRAIPQEEYTVEVNHSNAYNTIMSRVKELVSLVEASRTSQGGFNLFDFILVINHSLCW